MAPMNSAYALYQRKKLQKLKRLKALKRQGKQPRPNKRRPIPPASDGDTDASSPEDLPRPKAPKISEAADVTDEAVPMLVNLIGTNVPDVAVNTVHWLLHPCDMNHFFNHYWEVTPYHISSRTPDKYEGLMSIAMIDTALDKEVLYYTTDMDITRYTDGTRKTLNPPGRARRKAVWDFYHEGCTVRLKRPQTVFPALRKLLSTFQEFFGSYVGANIYLTPPNSQGFAPHFDDIEAFILQVEGQKRWKIYRPSPGGVLPRDSSADFGRQELGKPFLEIVLKQGDMLYFPRGWIHEASTVPGNHSMHITVSCYQHQAWIDLFEKMVEGALQKAAGMQDFRAGLPVGYLYTVGVSNSDVQTPGRTAFKATLQTLKNKFMKCFNFDAAVDQMAKDFMHKALPPNLDEEEIAATINAVETFQTPEGDVTLNFRITKDMEVKLIRPLALRIISEAESDSEAQISIYHRVNNSFVHGEGDEHSFQVDEDEALMIDYLAHKYPTYVEVSDMPQPQFPVASKVALAEKLFNHGLLMVRNKRRVSK